MKKMKTLVTLEKLLLTISIIEKTDDPLSFYEKLRDDFFDENPHIRKNMSFSISNSENNGMGVVEYDSYNDEFLVWFDWFNKLSMSYVTRVCDEL